MATPNYGPAVQDMPPKGGFRPLRFARGVPEVRGPPGWAMFAGCFAVTSIGFYLVGQQNQETRALRREVRERRIAMLPFLQAEEDIEFLQNEAHYLEQEKERMKSFPGWKVGESPYHSKKWQIPLYAK